MLGFGSHKGATAYIWGASLGSVLIAVAVFLASWRLQARSWLRIALGYLVLVGVLAYLAHDEPTFRHPMTMEEISPVFPGAEDSYNVLMRYGKQHPLGQSFIEPSFKGAYDDRDPGRPDLWRKAITARRPEFEAHWAALAGERAWWAELNAFDRMGDLMPARADAEIVSFGVLRAVSQNGIAIASLQALDGRGDEAIDTLLPILEVGRKMQPYSRSLVRQMIGIVIEKLSIKTANFILDNTAVSPAARARLAAALQGGGGDAGARHIFLTEYAVKYGWMSHSRVGDILGQIDSVNQINSLNPWIRWGLNVVSPFIYNPRETFNQVGDLYAECQDLAASRNIEKIDEKEKDFVSERSRPAIKNIYGRWIGAWMIPAYLKVTENYWATQDIRAALIARLAKQ